MSNLCKFGNQAYLIDIDKLLLKLEIKKPWNYSNLSEEVSQKSSDLICSIVFLAKWSYKENEFFLKFENSKF